MGNTTAKRKEYYYRDHAESLRKLREYREKNRDKLRAQQRNRRATKGDEVRAYARKYHAENRDRRRDYTLRTVHGITLEQHGEMLAAQGGGCAICRKALVGRDAHVDHDHATDVVRELLCFNCNAGLGHYRDNQETLAAAIEYLKKHSQLQLRKA